MILRRLAQSIRKQDWFAVVIETLIVVFGVLIGLQVNNWNEARTAAGREANLIAQLHEAFVVESQNVTEGREEIEALRNATSVVLEALGQDEAPSDVEEFRFNLLMATVAIGPVYEVPIVSVMMSTGDLAELSSPGLRNSLMTYHFQIGGLQSLSANQMQMVSNLTNGGQIGIQIEMDEETGFYRVSDYDFEMLKSARPFYQSQLAILSTLLAYIGDLEATTAAIAEELEIELK